MSELRWRDRFMRSCGAGPYAGLSLGAWWRVLRDNHFAVDPIYWPRGVSITMAATGNTLVGGIEDVIFGRKVARTEIPPPVIILGAWRSGTTHLHNLFAQDNRFAYPNLYQVSAPRTFLLTETFIAPFMGLFVPAHRPQDNVRMGVNEPQEDEFAIFAVTGYSPMMVMAFPRNAAFHERFMALRELTPRELERWKRALVGFLKKLTYKHNRPLVLKTPPHTCRIDVLRKLFPQAKFVHIRRNPYEVFSSMKHTWIAAGMWWQLQRAPSESEVEELILRQYRELYDVYFAQKQSIPPGHLHEIAYEDLERDPIGQLSAAYAALGLPDFSYAEPRVRHYVESIAGYKRNAFKPLPEALRQRVATEWRRCFDEWRYPI